ncbi:hypothetical protein [Aquibium microcysteis]|uniref:hypothetical protein n=1 Tax=Aquibium microcysteis TaxID=675281 RepID=UPI00165D1413|nr:hypothetical protein [Aquibium microcysteis]
MAVKDDAETGHEVTLHVAMTVERDDFFACRYRAAVARQVTVAQRLAKRRHMVPLNVGMAAADENRSMPILQRGRSAGGH